RCRADQGRLRVERVDHVGEDDRVGGACRRDRAGDQLPGAFAEVDSAYGLVGAQTGHRADRVNQGRVRAIEADQHVAGGDAVDNGGYLAILKRLQPKRPGLRPGRGSVLGAGATEAAKHASKHWIGTPYEVLNQEGAKRRTESGYIPTGRRGKAE